MGGKTEQVTAKFAEHAAVEEQFEGSFGEAELVEEKMYTFLMGQLLIYYGGCTRPRERFGPVAHLPRGPLCRLLGQQCVWRTAALHHFLIGGL